MCKSNTSRLKIWYSLLLISGLSLSVFSQSKFSLITWTDFNYTYNHNEKFGLGGDAGLRGIITKPDWSMIYVRPSVKYHLTPFVQLGASLGFFETFQAEPSDMFEMRLAQEARAQWPSFNNFYFIHRARFEERFLFYNPKNTADDFTTEQQNFRFRYLLNARTNYFKLANRAEYFYLVAGAEYFIPVGENVDERFFNASRLSVGFGQELKLNWNYEVDVIWQRSRNTLEGDFSTDEVVIRLRVYFDKYKKDAENKDSLE